MESVGKQSPVFVKTHDFVCWLIGHTIKFPKSQRFVMARRVEETALEFEERLIRAARAKGRAGTKDALSTADTEALEGLRRVAARRRLSIRKGCAWGSLPPVAYGSMAISRRGAAPCTPACGLTRLRCFQLNLKPCLLQELRQKASRPEVPTGRLP